MDIDILLTDLANAADNKNLISFKNTIDLIKPIYDATVLNSDKDIILEKIVNIILGMKFLVDINLFQNEFTPYVVLNIVSLYNIQEFVTHCFDFGKIFIANRYDVFLNPDGNVKPDEATLLINITAMDELAIIVNINVPYKWKEWYIAYFAKMAIGRQELARYLPQLEILMSSLSL